MAFAICVAKSGRKWLLMVVEAKGYNGGGRGSRLAF
jgi:hypothetical protein